MTKKWKRKQLRRRRRIYRRDRSRDVLLFLDKNSQPCSWNQASAKGELKYLHLPEMSDKESWKMLCLIHYQEKPDFCWGMLGRGKYTFDNARVIKEIQENLEYAKYFVEIAQFTIYSRIREVVMDYSRAERAFHDIHDNEKRDLAEWQYHSDLLEKCLEKTIK